MCGLDAAGGPYQDAGSILAIEHCDGLCGGSSSYTPHAKLASVWGIDNGHLQEYIKLARK
jgi:hypothetical protein